MARKKIGGIVVPADPARIHAFAADAPIEGADEVERQMRLAHRYRNRLVAIELDRRAEYASLMREHDQAVAEAEAALAQRVADVDAKRTAINAAKQRGRTRAVDVELADALRESRAALKAAKAALKAAKVAAREDPVIREAVAALTVRSQDAARAARQEFAREGLYWGTYLCVEAAAAKFGCGAPPRFTPYTEEGTVGIQVQQNAEREGLTWEDALSCTDSRVRIQLVPRGPRSDPHSRRSGDIRARRAIVSIRVRSEGRQPVWARVPVSVYRDPPPGTRITFVHLKRIRIGYGWRWRILFFLARPGGWEDDRPALFGRCGVDLGWRLHADGSLRVAYLVGDDDHERDFRLAASHVDRFAKADSLRAIRDREFNAARTEFVTWLKAKLVPLPEWLETMIQPRQRDEQATCSTPAQLVSHWKSSRRLYRVVWRWKDHRFDGDDAMYERLETWRKKERHLADWEAHQRIKASSERNRLYRLFAREIADRYRHVAMENMNIRELRERADADGTDLPQDARFLGHVAAVGTLRQYIVEAARAVSRIPAEHTTQDCHCCGHRNVFEETQRGRLILRCSSCGASWDQDRNAAVNLLRAIGPAPADAGGADVGAR